MGQADIAQRLRTSLARCPQDLVAAYLFGSIARGEGRADSDVDVGVLLREPLPGGLDRLGLDLESELEAAMRRPVQVVVLNAAPVDLIHRVLRDGELVLERDHAARVRFEVRARSEYLDLLPTLRRYRRHGGAAR